MPRLIYTGLQDENGSRRMHWVKLPSTFSRVAEPTCPLRPSGGPPGNKASHPAPGRSIISTRRIFHSTRPYPLVPGWAGLTREFVCVGAPIGAGRGLMEEADGYEGGGYGKAQRGRRHRTQTGKTPYSRPGPKPVAKEGPLKEQPASEPAPGGLFGSLRTLITKVRPFIPWTPCRVVCFPAAAH